MKQFIESYNARTLDSFYNHAYFHGETSGYSTGGYAQDHANWTTWIQLIRGFCGSDVKWLDVGCAYGYFLKQAAAMGVMAYGMDVSSYALRQQDSVKDRLVQSLAETLPYKDSCMDVVSLFDVVEHLQNPEIALREAHRILKPDGILLLTTPDPIYFQRAEVSHIHERPPSYWVHQLQKLEFKVALRFGGQPYEVEIMGFLSHDAALYESFLQQRNRVASKIISKDSILVPRIIKEERALYDGDQFYLLNDSTHPQKIYFTISSPNECHPDLFLGDLKLNYQGCSQNGTSCLHSWKPIVIPPGGFSLAIRIQGEPVAYQRLEAQTIDVLPEEFLAELSFDHFQRYRMVSQLIEGIEGERLRILDIGGALGYLPLFVEKHDVLVLDRVWEDSPSSLRYAEDTLPFSRESWDVVVSVDTLEHIPQAQRESFLQEMMRVAKNIVILCCPFDDPNVADAESIVHDFLSTQLRGHDRFLEEHALYSLPVRQQVKEIFTQGHFNFIEIPNGFLPRWLLMQLLNFALGIAPEQFDTKRRLNRLYNMHYYWQDLRDPAYRYAFVASRRPITGTMADMVQRMLTTSSNGGDHALWDQASLIVSLSNYEIIRDQNHYSGEQGRRLQKLIEHLDNLSGLLRDETEQREGLLGHSNNLQNTIQELQKHGDNLTKLFRDKQDEVHRLHETFSKQNENQISLQKHAANLASLLNEKQKEVQNYQKMYQEQGRNVLNLQSQIQKQDEQARVHAENLTKRLEERDQHLTRLQEHIQNLEQNQIGTQAHAKNLENILDQERKHARNLEHLLHERDKHIHNLEIFIHQFSSQLQQVSMQFGDHFELEESTDLSHALQKIQTMLASLSHHSEYMRSVLTAGAFPLLARLRLVPQRPENQST